jgi:hypothetical protein
MAKVDNAIKAALIGGGFAVVAALIPVAITNHWFSTNPPSRPSPSPSSPSGPSNSSTGAGNLPSSAAHSQGKQLIAPTVVQLNSGYALSISGDKLIVVPNNGCAGDLWICGNTDIGSSAQLAPHSGTAGFSQCQSDTNYVSSTGEMPQQSLVGTTLCVTTADRIAVCHVTGDTRWDTGPTNGLTMDVTVYSLH